MYIGIIVKYALFLSDFNETWIFMTVFRKLLKYEISWKSTRLEPSCSMLADGRLGQAEGRTDMTKLMVAFRSFSHAPKNSVRDNRIFDILVHYDTT